MVCGAAPLLVGVQQVHEDRHRRVERREVEAPGERVEREEAQ